jgi:two-component system sensor histidine kinase KdpD
MTRPVSGRSANPTIFRLLKFLLAILITALVTALLFLLRDELNTTTVSLIYFLPILISTTLWGLWPGVLSAFTAFLAYNYFFLQPYYTFTVHETQDLVALTLFLVTAVIISQLVGRARSNLADAVARESETTRLYELSLELAGVNSMDEIASVVARKTAETVHPLYLEIIIQPIYGESLFRLSDPESFEISRQPEAVIPLETVRGVLGEIRLWLDGDLPGPGEMRMLHAFAAQGAVALERTALAQAETRAKILEESDRLKSSLLSSVSHEFRTPIATIKAATTSLLIEDIPWETSARIDLLNTMDEEVDYLNYLVGNLLDMSRIEAGALRPNKEWNILSEILEDILSRMHRVLSGFQLDVRLPDDLPLVPVDYSQMEQVFTNLLNNSAKYAPKDSVIQISAQVVDEDSLMVVIKNEGPQVIPEHLDRIFDKFYRVTEPEKVSGTGLGLSICKGIIEAHEGRIWAENIPGGLAFSFTLPLTLEGNPPPTVDTDSE